VDDAYMVHLERHGASPDMFPSMTNAQRLTAMTAAPNLHFLGPIALARAAAIPLTADVPIGNFAIDVELFADGAMVAHTNSALEVTKAGFEQYVADAARDHGLLYGLAAMLMALTTGWLASIVFRKD
jgi:uncharacterized protein (TIGR02186 family)